MSTQIVKKGKIEIRLNKDNCAGCGTCAILAPNTFFLDPSNISCIKEGEWDQLDLIIQAASACPTTTIEVYNQGKKIFPKE